MCSQLNISCSVINCGLKLSTAGSTVYPDTLRRVDEIFKTVLRFTSRIVSCANFPFHHCHQDKPKIIHQMYCNVNTCNNPKST